MKRCPECRREYSDDALNFCLDDGEWLVAGDEPATAILHSTDAPGEAPTRAQMHTTAEAEPRDDLGNAPEKQSFSALPPPRPSATPPLAGGELRRPPLLCQEGSRAKPLILGGLALILLVVGGYIGYRAFRKSPAPFSSVKVAKLTNTGNIESAAISPNGETVAATVFENGKSSIRIWDIKSGSNTQIMPPSDDRISVFAYAPDGRSIFYMRLVSPVDSTIARAVDIYETGLYGGGPSKKLLDKVGTAALSRDGKHWAFVRPDTQPGENSIFISKSDGSEEKKITTLKGTSLGAYIAWSPDGKSIASTISSDSRTTSLATVSIEDGEVTPITAKKWFVVGGLTWLPTGEGLVFSAGDIWYALKVWYISYPNGELKSLTNDPGSYGFGNVNTSADGSIIAATPSENVANIFLAPIDNLSLAKLLPGETVGTARARAFSWTPDDRIVYASDASGNSDIWIENADGSGKKQLTNDPAYDSQPRVSPDGSSIAFESTRSGSFDIWRMNIDGSDQRRITNGGINFKADFSRDGRWVIYEDEVSSQLRKISVDGGDPLHLIDKTVLWPSVSLKSGRIAGLYRSDPASPLVLAVFDPDGGPPIKTFPVAPGFLVDVIWMPDDRSIVYQAFRSGTSSIWSQPLDGGSPKLLADFSPESVFSMGLSRDGKTLVFSKGKNISDVVLITDLSKE